MPTVPPSDLADRRHRPAGHQAADAGVVPRHASARPGQDKGCQTSIIVSNDAANRELNRVQVVSRTSNVGRLYPSEAYVTLNNEQRQAMADQIATISKLRLRDRLRRLDRYDMEAVARAIRIQLGI